MTLQQEISNMIYEIKEQITDKDFKDIMEKLSEAHHNQKPWYKVRVIRFRTKKSIDEDVPDPNSTFHVLSEIETHNVRVDNIFISNSNVDPVLMDNHIGHTVNLMDGRLYLSESIVSSSEYVELEGNRREIELCYEKYILLDYNKIET